MVDSNIYIIINNDYWGWYYSKYNICIEGDINKKDILTDILTDIFNYINIKKYKIYSNVKINIENIEIFKNKNVDVKLYNCDENKSIKNLIDNFINIDINKKNRGYKAGGANTTYNGKKFEEKTNNEERLLINEYKIYNLSDNKYGYYLRKTFNNKTITYTTQHGLKIYVKNKYNIELFRCPDEAYIIEYNKDKTSKIIIKILEKKEQKVEGSVETKLWSGPSLKREYEIVFGDKFIIHYSFCVNEFLKKKLKSEENKYLILNQILNENNIHILYGDDIEYYNELDKWINLD